MVWHTQPRRVLLLSKPISVAPELLVEVAKAAALLVNDHGLTVRQRCEQFINYISKKRPYRRHCDVRWAGLS
jgi:hypothetical protein